MPDYQHQWHATGDVIALNCSKVVCVGRNYADHVKEMSSAVPDEPVLFIKPHSAICDARQDLKISHLAHLGELHHELEISLLIGEQINPTSHEFTSAIAGVGLGIDLTLRDVQTKLKQQGLPWERAKAFDNSCVLSRFVKSEASFDFANIELQLVINDENRQHGNSKMMLTPIPQLLEQISKVFTLMPGDVVLTGTPAGVGPLMEFDELSAFVNKQQLINKLKIT
ncbi:MAG: 2-keto-4-pentenoate hydratase/2-oxohepta-3-ene-1,7-dioic acid hydratase in catechol pathway [Arenicella sp.]|jgi:2-keto-4-pentenoate hydratase/2-oxohepta-3-ene-1,7-dioic acid hydratase in catechol pathway